MNWPFLAALLFCLVFWTVAYIELSHLFGG